MLNSAVLRELWARENWLWVVSWVCLKMQTGGSTIKKPQDSEGTVADSAVGARRAALATREQF